MARNPFWTKDFNVWVSRKDADGMIYRASVPAWIALGGFLLAEINFLGWAIYGIVKLVGHIV